jgi:hypothetical protein
MSIVGRERELAISRQFVRDIATGPAALVFEGVAGIGKTAIWTGSSAGCSRRWTRRARMPVRRIGRRLSVRWSR